MVRLRTLISQTPGVNVLFRAAYRLVRPTPRFRSAAYWDARYRGGETSGAGSYGRLARFKAEVLNNFVAENHINSVIEFGCGDGAQLSLAQYPKYTGVDVSQEAVDICRKKFDGDQSKSFLLSGAQSCKGADLGLSLDVIYHLIEDQVFSAYMRQLVSHSSKYICIYSSNYNGPGSASHVKHRRFTDWMAKSAPDWRLLHRIDNRYPFDPDYPSETSESDFYIFSRAQDCC